MTTSSRRAKTELRDGDDDSRKQERAETTAAKNELQTCFWLCARTHSWLIFPNVA